MTTSTAPPVVVLDGGLSNVLAERGHDLTDELWTARLLRDAPDEIAAVHRAYFDAGAQVYSWDGTTATSLIALEGATPEHLFAFDGKLYVAAADAGGNGLLYSYDGTNWRLVTTLAENWVQSGAAFGTLYYLGSGRDNRIWQFNGRDLVEVLGGYGPHGSRVRGLVAFGGRLLGGGAWRRGQK